MIWFGWVLWHINHFRLFNAKSSLYIYIKYIWFGWVGVLWHINNCRLFYAKSSLYIYIKYIWFVFFGFYDISTIIGYSMPNSFDTYILNIYDLVGLGWVLWHINHYRLFNTKSSLYIYINYIGFGLVGFYGISTIVGYLMLNPIYIYICFVKVVWLVLFYGISTFDGYLIPNLVWYIAILKAI